MIAMRRAMAAAKKPNGGGGGHVVRALPELLGALPASRRATNPSAACNAKHTPPGRSAMHIRQPANHWSDILSFLFFSALAGLACGAALGVLALLLAAPAYGAETAREGELLLRAREAEETIQ